MSFGDHTFEIIAYLLSFSTSFDIIVGLKTMTEIEGRSNYSKVGFIFKKRSIDITTIKGIHLPVGKTTAFHCEMKQKPSLMHISNDQTLQRNTRLDMRNHPLMRKKIPQDNPNTLRMI